MAALQVQIQPSSPTHAVLTVTGELDVSTQDELEQAVGRALAPSSVVLDLSGLDFFAISALRSLMVCHQLAGTAGHDICFAGPDRHTRRLLAITGLDEVLPVAASVGEAVGESPVDDRVADQAPGRVPDQTFRNLAQLDVG